MKSITIQGVSVEVAQPYVAGHPVTEAEAKALNQVRAENIRNNMAAKVKEIKGDSEELSQEQLDAIAAAVSKYDAEYVFNLASVGGGARSTDPLEVQTRSLARQLVSNSAKQQGLKLKDIDKEVLAAKIEEVMQIPEVIAEAKKLLKQKQKLAEASSISF